MVKFFIDSIVFRIDYTCNEDKVLKFNNIINYIENLPNTHLNSIQKVPAKFYKMHLSINNFGKKMIECVSFTDNIQADYQKVYIYSTYHGINIALHGLVQYNSNDFRKEKLVLLHKLYKRHILKLIKLDVSMDIHRGIEDIVILDNKEHKLEVTSNSKKKSYFFQEGTQDRSKQQRSLKMYEKFNQKHREFPYADKLTRIEMSLRASKLKVLSQEYIHKRIVKELNHYIINIDEKHHVTQKEHINLLVQDFFNILENGKNTKIYSSYYRNITITTKNMSLSWQCYKNKIPKKVFIKSNNISLTSLKKYSRFYQLNLYKQV